MNPEIEIPFSFNWNNKLDCLAFTTIRIYNPHKHVKGYRVKCILSKTKQFYGRIAEVKPFLLDKLNPYMAYLDTGYSVEECKALLLKMYPKIDFSVKHLAFILIVKEKQQ